MAGLTDDLRMLDERVGALDERIAQMVHDDSVAERLLTLRAVGPLMASALTGAVGNEQAFSNGHDCAASLGLVPHLHLSGGKPRPLGISKRGDSYLRKLLIHGARAVLRHVRPTSTTCVG